MTVVFLGGGRITSALLAGLKLRRAKYRTIVHDRNLSKMRKLKKEYGAIPERSLQRAVAQADLLIIAVRPNSVIPLLHELSPPDRPLIAVSLAAGLPLRHLRPTLGRLVQWARAMPSPASRSGRGLAALSFSPRFNPQCRRQVRDFFAKVGEVVEIPEREFDAFTVTYSSSHGYHALSTLAEAGRLVGLNRKTALTAAAHAFVDGLIAWRDGEHSIEALLDEAATPGGIAATTMDTMNKAGYVRAVRAGIQAGLRLARANTRQ